MGDKNKTYLPSDEEIVKKVLSGDTDSFRTIVEKYTGKAERLIFSLCHNQDHTEDILQNVFLKVFKNLSRFKGESQFKTWFYRVAYNESLLFLRERKREVSFSALEVEEEVVAPDRGDKASDKELGRILENAIYSLDGESRFLLILREKEGLAYEEIARTLNLPLSTVKIRLHRTRLKLRKLLRPFMARKGKRFSSSLDAISLPSDKKNVKPQEQEIRESRS